MKTISSASAPTSRPKWTRSAAKCRPKTPANSSASGGKSASAPPAGCSTTPTRSSRLWRSWKRQRSGSESATHGHYGKFSIGSLTLHRGSHFSRLNRSRGGAPMPEPKPRRRRSEIDDDDDDFDRDEERRRKKKKKNKPARKARWPMITAIVGGGVMTVGLLVVVIWAIVYAASGGAAVQPVTAWDRFKTDEHGFAFEYPKGWRAKGYGIRDRREAEVKGVGGATINVKENLAGSLIGDIANAAAGGRQLDDDHLPVVAVHNKRRPNELPSYKELDEGVTLSTKLGKVRRSAYSDGSRR